MESLELREPTTQWDSQESLFQNPPFPPADINDPGPSEPSTDTRHIILIGPNVESTSLDDNEVSHNSDSDGDTQPSQPHHSRDQENSESHESSKPRRNHQHQRGVWVLWSWRYQIASLTFSFATLIGLAAFAAFFADKPLSEWPLDSRISINTVVALLTTAMRGALLVPVSESIAQQKWLWFSGTGLRSTQDTSGRQLGDIEKIDDASRGLWGSASWILGRPKSLSLVSLGAYLTIIAAAFDVFSQQLVRVDSRTIIDSSLGPAQIPWAQHVYPFDVQTWWNAIYDGILNPIVDDLQGSCPTGNCTWDTVPSIGICGECRNCTDLWLKSGPVEQCDSTSSWCNYTGFGVGASLTNVPAPGRKWSIGNQLHQGVPVTSVAIASDYAYNAQCFPELDPLPWTPILLETIQASFEEYRGHFTFGRTNLSQCAFWYCMNAFSTNTSLGHQKQVLLRSGVQGRKYKTRNGHLNIYFPDTLGFNMLGRNFTVLDGYAYRSYHILGSNYLGFTGWDSYYQNPDAVARVWQETNHNRSAWASKFAKRLSNTIRQQSAVSPSEDPYLGLAYSQQAYIRIVWGWIAYPASVLVVTLLVFVATVIVAARGRTCHWGNGMNALLLADVDEEIQNTVEISDAFASPEQLAATVNGIKVRLEQNASKWVFKKI